MFRATTKIMVSAICVLAAAAPSWAAVTAASIAGRCQGQSYDVSKDGGKLTLDIVACGAGWCGVKVEANNACGGTALKIDAGAPDGDNVLFKGTLELAPKTEPYVVHSWLVAADGETPLTLQITGDTGGEYRVYRRSFPFEVQMTRTQDAVCHAPQGVS
jgi:hypothetical protein